MTFVPETMESALTFFPPGEGRSYVVDLHRIVHVIPFFVRSRETRRYYPHMTQCFDLARGYATATERVTTCLFCVGWENEMPGNIAVMPPWNKEGA